jgi:hypothetical protein
MYLKPVQIKTACLQPEKVALDGVRRFRSWRGAPREGSAFWSAATGRRFSLQNPAIPIKDRRRTKSGDQSPHSRISADLCTGFMYFTQRHKERKEEICINNCLP